VTGCGLHFFRWLVLYLLLSFGINIPKFKSLLIFTKNKEVVYIQEPCPKWAAGQKGESW